MVAVTFDFDNTLSRSDVQEYAKELIKKGFDVWVLTSRYDDLHKHRYHLNPTNEDLWGVVDLLGIPKHKVRFTCFQPKSNYLDGTNVLWHLDDDQVELESIIDLELKTIPISVLDKNWIDLCNMVLFNSKKLTSIELQTLNETYKQSLKKISTRENRN